MSPEYCSSSVSRARPCLLFPRGSVGRSQNAAFSSARDRSVMLAALCGGPSGWPRNAGEALESASAITKRTSDSGAVRIRSAAAPPLDPPVRMTFGPHCKLSGRTIHAGHHGHVCKQKVFSFTFLWCRRQTDQKDKFNHLKLLKTELMCRRCCRCEGGPKRKRPQCGGQRCGSPAVAQSFSIVIWQVT